MSSLRRRVAPRTAVVAASLALLFPGLLGAERARSAPPLPTATKRWIGEPASWPALRGKVVLLDVWTFGWINCVRTIPWVREALRRYGPRGLTAVGIHTPEFDHERNPDAVREQVRRHELAFSHLLDDDRAYWQALGNQYWPTLYLVDRCGTVRTSQVGEVHAGEESGRRLEAAIEVLLAEDRCPAP